MAKITISDVRSPGFNMSHRSICRVYQIGDLPFVRLLLFVMLAIVADARISFGQSEMPEFTGDRLVFSGVDAAAWQSLPPVIAELEKSGHETYYIVVVESSGSGPTATKDYTDRLYEHWLQQAARNSIAFDTQRSVLVVLAIQNRQISVKAGQTLLQEYGLNGTTIDQQLVQPYFIPMAKAGNYPEGVTSLLRQLNARILAHDQPKTPSTVSQSGRESRRAGCYHAIRSHDASSATACQHFDARTANNR
jgi:uncharacterized membrane protein YgcG